MYFVHDYLCYTVQLYDFLDIACLILLIYFIYDSLCIVCMILWLYFIQDCI